MTNRILLIVIIIILALLALSASLIILLISSPTQPTAQSAATIQPVITQQTDSLPSLTENITTFTVTLPSAVTPTPQKSTSSSVVHTETPAETPASETGMPSIAASQTLIPGPLDPTPTPSTNMPCNKTNSFSTSFILEDTNTYEAPFGAELIRLVNIDFVHNQFTNLALSSFLKLPAPDLKDSYGISDATLGNIYHTVYQRTTNADLRYSNASLAVNQVIQNNFGLVQDFYISLDQKFLKQWVKFTGPVEIDNPEGFSTREYQYPAGKLSINASNIWDYLTYAPDADQEFARLQRQDILLAALFDAIKANHSLEELQNWIGSFEDLFRTNMTLDELTSTFCALSYSTKDTQKYIQIPAEYLFFQTDNITVDNPEQVIEFIVNNFSTTN